MGLLDGLLGNALGGLLGGGGNAAGGGATPDLLRAVVGMLGNDAQGGGLGGLLAKAQQAGLGDVVGSWVGTGQNQEISPSQLGGLVNNDMIAGLAKQLGISPDAALGQLSQVLPQVVDKLTPNGQVPQGGLGNTADLLGGLAGLLKR